MTPREILPFLSAHRLAVVSTVHAGAPQSAVVGYAVTDALDIIFDTLSTSRKYKNLAADPRVALVIGWDNEQTVQIEGLADVPTGPDLDACKQAYFAAWPDGPERAQWPDIAYVRIQPRWLRFSDFSCAPPRIEEMALA
ncbi:pyridoxamine 5'-phosphate oxidase family protein [Bradyrhizobium sp. NP1]|uniref:pyridoxamine 5'-phosphate oxidase family protein n=1 Tax=Bradyrhizobium sp. NP1 TaxID=3049772 RepID=UPI0025A531A5|nr:pyridoxamine 5'-phosphate oxidase family protein [Bradyrhizobium sp. NP1]WJR79642.1 pyridoxamine 5'-phosphate oxidase family protein [Bradyrhizobium sp. NP1]